MGLEPFTPGTGDDNGEPVLTLTDQQIQQAGVRTEKVLPRKLVREISTSGMLMKNRERYWHIDIRFEGWIEELFVNAEGETIRKGDPVATIYSPQLYATQKEYLLAMDDPQLGQAARKRLELMGISGEEIKELEDRGEPTARMTVRSEVLDGPRSVVIQEAQNRLVAQMAVLHRMLVKST